MGNQIECCAGNRGPINSKDNYNLKNLKQLPQSPDWILKDIPGLYDSDSSSIIRLHEQSLSDAIHALNTNDTIQSLLKGQYNEAPLQLSLMCEVTSPLCSPKSNERNFSFILGTSLPELSELFNKPNEDFNFDEQQDFSLYRKESQISTQTGDFYGKMKDSNSKMMIESNNKMHESSSQSTKTLEQGFMMESNIFQQFKDNQKLDEDQDFIKFTKSKSYTPQKNNFIKKDNDINRKQSYQSDNRTEKKRYLQENCLQEEDFQEFKNESLSPMNGEKHSTNTSSYKNENEKFNCQKIQENNDEYLNNDIDTQKNTIKFYQINDINNGNDQELKTDQNNQNSQKINEQLHFNEDNIIQYENL